MELVALIAFAILIVSWMALPAPNEQKTTVAEKDPVIRTVGAEA